MNRLKKDVNIAGRVMKKAKDELEKELKSSVVTNQNFIGLTQKEAIKNK
jgi:hypothetical protein